MTAENRAEYWKAEHTAANEEIERLRAQITLLERQFGEYVERFLSDVECTNSERRRYKRALDRIKSEHCCDAYNPDGAEPTCRDQVPDYPKGWCPHCIALEALEKGTEMPLPLTDLSRLPELLRASETTTGDRAADEIERLRASLMDTAASLAAVKSRRTNP